MAKIALLAVGCFLVLGLAEACGVRPWHHDWKVCPPCTDVYYDLWLYCKQYPEDNPCQLCHLGRSSPQHTLLRYCLLNPNDAKCVRFRPSRPIRGYGSKEKYGKKKCRKY